MITQTSLIYQGAAFNYWMTQVTDFQLRAIINISDAILQMSIYTH